MTKKTTQKDIAAALGVTRERVTKLASLGMPTASIGAAQEWRAKRSGRPAKALEAPGEGESMPSVESVPKSKALGMIAGLEERLADALRMAGKAQRRAESEIDGGDGEAAKRANDLYASAARTVLLLENTLRQRRIDAGQLVPMEAAVENYGKRLSTLLGALDAEESDFSIAANPDNPGRAAKAFRAMRDRVRTKASAV